MKHIIFTLLLLVFGSALNAPLARSSPTSKPNARHRDGFGLVPSFPVGCADKVKVGALGQ